MAGSGKTAGEVRPEIRLPHLFGYAATETGASSAPASSEWIARASKASSMPSRSTRISRDSTHLDGVSNLPNLSAIALVFPIDAIRRSGLARSLILLDVISAHPIL
jgi:hypothetical protein